jgi:hypothetical protein
MVGVLLLEGSDQPVALRALDLVDADGQLLGRAHGRSQLEERLRGKVRLPHVELADPRHARRILSGQ